MVYWVFHSALFEDAISEDFLLAAMGTTEKFTLCVDIIFCFTLHSESDDSKSKIGSQTKNGTMEPGKNNTKPNDPSANPQLHFNSQWSYKLKH